VVSGRFVGTSVPRREDDRLLRGRGRFVADLVRADTLHVAFVRSTQAHAAIQVRAEGARSHPGVVLVLTGADLAGRVHSLPPMHRPDAAFVEASGFVMPDVGMPVLAMDRTRYVGEAMVAVVAASRAIAEDAAELVEVDYEPLPVVMSADAALAPDAPVVHDAAPGNLAAALRFDVGDVDQAVAGAAVTVTETYRMGRHSGIPLECRGVVAGYDERRRRVELWTSSQVPHLVRRLICAATGWRTDELRVAVPEVGGGFGPKANVYNEEVVLAVLARLLHREVAWIEDRAEHMVSSAQARDQLHVTRLSVDADGRIVAWEDEYQVDVGAHSLWTGGIIANTALHSLGAYRIPAFRLSGRAAYTNKTPVAQYRGAGRPEACFALERSLDAAARELGISPVEIRRRNLLDRSDLPHPRPMPYRDGVPIVYDGADYLACLDACVDALGPKAVESVRAEFPDRLVGYGIATYVEATGRGPYESAAVRLTPSGTFVVAAGSASAGQSHETTLAQVAADALCTDMSCVVALEGDTDVIAEGIGTFASRSAVLAGSAVHLAATDLVARARALVARLVGESVEAVRPAPGGFRTRGGRKLSWAQLAAELAPGGRLHDEPPLEATHRFSPPTVTWTMGAHAAVVTVDPDTGICAVVRYAVAHETGDALHPQVVDGQIVGGVAQGIGGALLEEFRYTDEGQPVSVTFADYLLPGMLEVPEVDAVHLHAGTDRNPLRIKGVGESGTIPVYAVVASAIDDALGGAAPRMTGTPMTPAVVRGALRVVERAEA
jgi:carbon-monoxide dehydrogenase large subunit